MNQEEFSEDDTPPEYHDIDKASGAVIVYMSDINKTVGADREEWSQAVHAEIQSMIEKSVYDVLTPEEVTQVNIKKMCCR